jgi:dihydroxyacetone kinase
MDNFFNEPARVVAEMLEGLAWLEPTVLVQGEGIRIVARRDWDRAQVAVISGGGAGHEPSHAGFVGSGMLTAAVSGEIFASPSVEAVLAGIRQVTGPAGCLLVVKNYTGDRLNFGLAAERARGEGLAVATVTVADDVALPGSAQPRGLAGTVLVHKLAGYLAARGESLEVIRQRAQALADSLATLGLALAPCHVPGRPAETRSPELGLGIHNEPGARPVAPASAREAMRLVLEPLLAHVEARSGAAPLVALLNDLGGCSPQELLVLTRELCSQLGAGRIVRMVRPSRLMTSLDMRGFSVTLVAASDELLAALDAPVGASAWPGTVTPHSPEIIAVPAGGGSQATARPQSAAVSEALRRACQAAIAARDALDALDAKVGDGDAGSTFASGARAVLDRLDLGQLSTGEPAALSGELGAVLAQAMGGSSGVLLSILFTAMGTSLGAGAPLAVAFGAGLERMQHHGGARAGDRTMLDALLPAAAALSAGGVEAAAKAAREGADATAAMTRAGAGRSSYVPDAALLGVVDPGAEAVARLLAALAG